MAEKGVEEQVLAMERLPCYGAFTSFVLCVQVSFVLP